MRKNRISSLALGKHTFHLTGDVSPGWPSTVGWIKISKHVNQGEDYSTWLPSLFRCMVRHGLNEITKRETFIEDKYRVLIRTIEKASPCERSPWEPVTTLHLDAPPSEVYLGCFPCEVIAPPGRSIWKLWLSPQIPGQSYCTSNFSSLNLRGGRQTWQSDFFLLQRRKALVVLEIQTEVVLKLDFMETPEIQLLNIILLTDKALGQCRSFSLLVIGTLRRLMYLPWSPGYCSELWKSWFTIRCAHGCFPVRTQHYFFPHFS